MDEQDQTKNGAQTSTEKGSDNGVQQQEPELIKQANNAAERLKAENDRAENILKQQQEAEARRALGGKSDGPMEKKPDEKPTDENIKKDLESIGW